MMVRIERLTGASRGVFLRLGRSYIGVAQVDRLNWAFEIRLAPLGMIVFSVHLIPDSET